MFKVKKKQALTARPEHPALPVRVSSGVCRHDELATLTSVVQTAARCGAVYINAPIRLLSSPQVPPRRESNKQNETASRPNNKQAEKKYVAAAVLRRAAATRGLHTPADVLSAPGTTAVSRGARAAGAAAEGSRVHRRNVSGQASGGREKEEGDEGGEC